MIFVALSLSFGSSNDTNAITGRQYNNFRSGILFYLSIEITQCFRPFSESFMMDIGGGFVYCIVLLRRTSEGIRNLLVWLT